MDLAKIDFFTLFYSQILKNCDDAMLVMEMCNFGILLEVLLGTFHDYSGESSQETRKLIGSFTVHLFGKSFIETVEKEWAQERVFSSSVSKP